MKAKNLYLFGGLLSAAMLVGCGGSSGGGTPAGGGTSSTSLPSNALTLTEDNAVDIAEASVSYVEVGSSAFGVDAQTVPANHQVINTVKRMVFNNEHRSYSVATGAEWSEACSGGGNITDTWTDSGNSYSGSYSFNNCIESGITLSGTLNYSGSWNESTGTYSDSADGSITFTMNSQSFTMTLDITESGNDNSGAYSTTIGYSISGNDFPGWLVETESPIVGNYNTGTYDSGRLIITGASNTKIRVTIVPTNSAMVELSTGGDYTEVAESPIYIY